MFDKIEVKLYPAHRDARKGAFLGVARSILAGFGAGTVVLNPDDNQEDRETVGYWTSKTGQEQEDFDLVVIQLNQMATEGEWVAALHAIANSDQPNGIVTVFGNSVGVWATTWAREDE